MEMPNDATDLSSDCRRQQLKHTRRGVVLDGLGIVLCQRCGAELVVAVADQRGALLELMTPVGEGRERGPIHIGQKLRLALEGGHEFSGDAWLTAVEIVHR